MADKLDLFLDFMDGLMPGFIVFVKTNISEIKDKNSKKRKTLQSIGNIIKFFYLCFSLYTLYFIYYVQGEKTFQVDIRTKALTTLVSVLLLLKPLYKSLFIIINYIKGIFVSSDKKKAS